MRTKKHIKRILALLLILVMTLGMLPMSALAGYEQAETAENSGENITVFVSLENTTFPGGAWSGTRLDRVPVNVPAGSTMMHAVVTAFAQHQISESGSAANFIETIDGLSWHVHPMGGWMMTLNDWFINAGAQAITVSSGDEIRVLFTIAFGEDIGGSWSNNDTSLRELTFSAGELYPVFNSATLEYTLTLPEGTDRVTVTPTAANKNFQVRTNVGGVVYQRSQAVPVTNGTVIVVGVGDPSWPTMNDPPFELTEYRITVYIPSQPPEEGPDNSAVYENGWLIVNIAYENGTGPSLRATIQEALTRAPFNQVSPYYDYSVIERLQITGYMHVYDFYINANVRDLFRGTGAGVNARALLSGLVELDLSGVPGIVGQRTNAQGNPLLGNFLNAAPTQAIQHMASLERLRLSSSIRVSGNFARDNLMLSTLAFDNQPFTEGLFDFTGIGNFNDTFLRASAEGQTSGGTFTFANTRPQAALFPAETGAGAIIPQGFFNNAATLREVHFYSATAPTLYNLNTFNLGSAIARPVAFVPDANAGGYDVDMFRNNFSNVISRDAVSVDRTELRAIIAEAQALEANAFTAASWAAMQAVLTSAQAAYAETAATQEELDGAVAALRSAINALMVYGDDITFIDAPYGATVGVFRKGTLHFAEFETFPMSVDSVLSGEGREIWRAAIPLNTPLHIEAFIPGQTAKQAVFFTAQSHGTTITVNPIALDDWIPGRGEAWHDANVVTNLGDTGTLNLPVGGTFNLDTIRVWQAMAGITANYFIEPEYIFEVFGDSISVAPIGAPGRQQLRITADSPGVSVIKITYNPVEYFQMGIGTLWFDAIDPRNALAVVVNVAGGSDFDTGITVRNDFDTWYFDASAGYREFTFTPAAGSSVRVHAPLNITPWGEGWTSYSAGEDGSFTVELKDGRNIIEVTNSTSVRHHVIRARGVPVTVENLTNPGHAFAAGDTARITIIGLSEPVEKLAGIYNPGFGAALAPRIQLINEDGEVFTSNVGTQFRTLTQVFTVDYTLEDISLNVLSGHIRAGLMGSLMGHHRAIPQTGLPPNFNAVAQGPFNFGALPVITLPVAQDSDGVYPPVIDHPLIVVVSPANAQDMNDQIRAILVRDFGQTSGQYDYSVVRRLAVAGNVTVNLFNQAITRDTIRPYLEELDLSSMTGTGSVTNLGGGIAPTAINYTALRHVIMPSRATTTANMFAGHSVLEFVTFAGNIPGTWSGNNYFQGATNLRNIAFLGDTAPAINANIFAGLPAGFAAEYITAIASNAAQGGYELAAFTQHFSDVVSAGSSWPASVDRTGLTTALAQAQAIDPYSLAPVSRPVLETAIATAQMIASNPLSLQSSVDAVTALLRHLLDTEFALIPVDEDVTFVVAPRGTTVGVFHKANNRHFTPFVSRELTLDTGRSNEQYDVWRVHIPLNQGHHIEAFGDETAKLARRITVAQHRTTVHVNPTPLAEWVDGLGTAWHDANLITNLDDTGAVNLAVDEIFDLDTFRVWQAMTGVTENYFVEPIYSFEIFGNSASVERIGTPGREQLRITATSPGVSVIKITYGPVEYILANGTTVHHFDALDPRNTLAVVVNVNGGTGFSTGMTGLSAPGVTIGEGVTVRNDFDTWYFDQADGYREFTFTPAAGTTVRVHSPLNIDAWGTGWTTYTADSEGSFTVRLLEGRNIIEMNNNGSVRHQVVRARGVEVVIENTTNPESTYFVEGDVARITIRGLQEPVEKLAGVYNPGFPAAASAPRLVFTNTAGERFTTPNSPQYQTLSHTFVLTHTLADTSLNVLNGQIYVAGMGSLIGAHRLIPAEGLPPNFTAGATPLQGFGALPEITIPVAQEEDLTDAEMAAAVLVLHDFTPVVQTWITNAATTRTAAIDAVRAQVAELLAGTSATAVVPAPGTGVNDFPNPPANFGVPPTDRTFTVNITGDDGSVAVTAIVVSIEFLPLATGTIIEAAIAALSEHNFTSIVQPWVSTPANTRTPAIANIVAQINAALSAAGITGVTAAVPAPINELPTLNAAGLPAADREFTVNLTGPEGTFGSTRIVLNIEFLRAAAAGVTIASAPVTGINHVIPDSTQQFNATIAPAGLTGVAWSIEGHSGASISETGLLSIGPDVPAGTTLTLRATTTTDMDADGYPVSSQLTINVVEAMTVFVSIEGFTIGHGFYIEPTPVRIPSAGGTANTNAMLATRILLDSHETLEFIGGAALTRIGGLPPGPANPPEFMLDAIAASGMTFNPNAINPQGLGNGDFGMMMAGWMLSHNHVMPNVGAGSVALQDGDVVRWMFTLLGNDHGKPEQGGGMGFAPPFFAHADKTELIRTLLTVSTPPAGSVQFALDVIENPLSSEAAVADAIAWLLGEGAPSLTLVPSSIALNRTAWNNAARGQSQTFTARVYDQFGTLYANQNVVWILIPGGTVAGGPTSEVHANTAFATGVVTIYAQQMGGAMVLSAASVANPDVNFSASVAVPRPLISLTAANQPALETVVTQGQVTGSLSAAPTVTLGAVLSYQWFHNSTDSTGGTAIPSATDATLTIPADLTAGEHFFYVVINATLGALPVTSRVATVIVEAAQVTDDWLAAMNSTLAYILTNVPAPSLGTLSGEWSVLALARAGITPGDTVGGVTMPENFFNDYVARLIAFMNGAPIDGVVVEDGSRSQIHTRRATDNQRVAITLASLGVDPRDVEGFNFLAPLSDYGWTTWQGVNSTAFALIAFDANNWDIPIATEENRPINGTGVQTTRENLIARLLAAELDGGGWALMGANYDHDTTFMVIQALAPYYNTRADVTAAIDRALAQASARQNANGGFGSSSEAIAQGIVALTALGIDPMEDERFIKNGNTMICALLAFYVQGGGFRNQLTSTGTNAMSTDQAAYALVAYFRFLNNQTRLYDMSDMFDSDPIITDPTTPVILISAQPQNASVTAGSITASLSVTATVTPEAELHFQWYRNTVNAATGGTPIEGATSASFTLPPNLAQGTHFLYVVISAQNATPVTSSVAVVTVSAPQGGGNGAGAPPPQPRAVISVIDPNARAGQTRVFFAAQEFVLQPGETAYSLLRRTGLEIRSTGHPTIPGRYVAAINGWGEFDDGPLSGWMFRVNGVFPNFSSSLYNLGDGDVVEWLFTRDLGADIGGDHAAGGPGADTPGTGAPGSGAPGTPGATPPPGGTVTQPGGQVTIPGADIPLADLETWENPFADVNSGDWFFGAVRFANISGIMQGVAGNVFSPNTNLSRAMIVTMLWRMQNEPAPAESNSFPDVASNRWYTDAIAWAEANGIVRGHANGLFAPGENVTREQLAVIMRNFARYLDVYTSHSTFTATFADAHTVSDWALDAKIWANAEGIITGRTETTLAPGGFATRAEAAAMLMRFITETVR